MNNNDIKLNPKELEVLKMFRSLTDKEQDHILTVMSDLVEAENKPKKEKITVGFTKELFNI